MKYQIIAEFWVEVLVSIVLFVLVYFSKLLPNLYRHLVARRFRQVIAFEQAKSELTHKLQIASGAHRTALCSAHNGGGVPVIGKAFYITIEHEATDLPVVPAKKDWGKRIPDSGHLELLTQLTRDRHVVVSVAGLTGELEEMHRAEDLTVSILDEIAVTKTKYWYVVCSFAELPKFTYEQRRDITSILKTMGLLLRGKLTEGEIEKLI